ncbi:C25 family cysteine peptidase [Candidatus Marithrix sp. Canyon 246]|uniref:C25 family cysteine peptidase n=1 Tax=Candidatus Marithrix sp. Canyon 246 TaxID=1827136 RepID=UPI0009F4F699|nr:C25 family cysteine peptidase [Candidatus Marithrix sp. Canyon 246]
MKRLFKILPTQYEADKIYLEPHVEASQANQDIIASINNGVMMSNYIGHGTIDKWSIDKGLFKSSDVEKLNNEQLIFALMLTCINGYFISSYAYSLAEEMVIAKTGAIGVFAASNFTYLWENAILAKYIFDSVFKQGNRKLGLITTQAKIKAYEQGASAEVLRMFTLFGDPALRLK